MDHVKCFAICLYENLRVDEGSGLESKRHNRVEIVIEFMTSTYRTFRKIPAGKCFLLGLGKGFNILRKILVYVTPEICNMFPYYK